MSEPDPLSSIIRQSLANRYITLGRYEEAERELERLLELDPGFVTAIGAKTQLASQRGRVYDQVRWLQRILEADPGRMGTYFDLLRAHLDLVYIAPLEDIRRTLLEINEEHPLIGMVDLVSAFYLGNHDGALESARWTYERIGRPAFLSASSATSMP